MRSLIMDFLKEIARDKTKRRRIKIILSMLSLVVVLTVFWQLRIVGISMTGEALCGKLEHTHTLECLVMQNVCGLEESEGHEHTDECYEDETVQVCQKEVHSHSDDCQVKREQVCELQEHQHGDACFKTENVLICTDESEGHVHISESATETVQVCQKQEHSHADDCQKDQEQNCDLEEHQHGDECFKTETLPACFEIRTTQVCEMDEHTHEESQCYVLTPCICEKEEHQHEETCFEIVDKLICGKDESEGHAHSPECQREVNGCGYEEEHRHTLMCYSDAEADLETSADWEAGLPELTGNASEDLVAVANSQLGYAESEQNYKVADDDVTKMGYSRYGEWYGNPYGNWNAMFVSFCLNYSNHPDYAALKNTGVETMRQAAVSADKYTEVEPNLVPAAGSIVFLDKDGNGSADRAAVVTYAGNGVISVVEGDYNGTVAEMEYSMGNGTIMGYALLPAREPQLLTTPAPKDALLMEEEAPEETVTVTYRIDNDNYTNDPGSGYTHLTVKSTDGLSMDGGLTYTSWASRYKVTGKGTLASFSIPTGSSLSANGYAAPDIQQEDIGSNNTFSYISSMSWVDSDGKIYADTTVINRDTTLYLYMYTPDSWYSLNYVCGCPENHSVNVSGYNATYTLGQSLSAPYIPTAAAVNEKYGVTSCGNYGKTFTGWYVKNETTGEEFDFGVGMPLVSDYLSGNAERTIKVYARWENASVSTAVTVTFVNGTEQNQISLNKGTALGEENYWMYIPEVEEGKIFAGWQTEDGAVIAQDTPLAEDLILTPVIADAITVIFEYEGGSTDQQIPEGTALGERFNELPDFAEITDKAFLGWVEKDSDGSTDYLTPETLIYEDTTYVPVFGVKVTLTFMNGEGDSAVEFKVVGDVPQGAYVWDYLPQETPLYTGTSEQLMEFAGWGRMNGETLELVSESELAETDMVLYAVFEEVTSFKVYLHDMASDGVTDYESQNSPISVPAGVTLQTYLNGNPYRMCHDGKPAAECKWHIKQIVDGNETYDDYALTVPVTTELHLYTFSYTVTLIQQEATSAALMVARINVSVSDDGNTLTLTLREGEKPTAADFIINGEDYTLYTWNYDDNGTVKTLDLADIIANGVSENITAVAASEQTTVTKNIWFYAIVNNERMLLSSDAVPCVQIGSRYYISAALLEKLYAEFGFRAEMLQPGTHYFPHAAAGKVNGIIWADADVVEQDGLYYSPVVADDQNADVYYLPKQTLPDGSQVYTDFLTTDSFYSITISDNQRFIYGADDEIPPVKYVLTGTTATVTLPDPSWEEGEDWLMNDNPLTGGVSNGDGTSTYTFTSVTAPIQITSFKENTFDIGYDINLDGFTPTSTSPNINGGTTFRETVEVLPDGTYLVGTPSTYRFTVNSINSLHTIIFKGWAVNGDTQNLISAGTILTGAQLKDYGSDIALVAQWEELGDDHSVSFYINLELQVADYTGNTDATPNENYTGALYGTELMIDPCPKCNEDLTLSPVDVIWADDQTGTAAVDAKIRRLAEGVKVTYMNAERTFTLGAFPNDEAMLAKIREAQAGYISSFIASGFYISTDPRNVTDYRAQMNADGKPLYRIISAEDEDGQSHYIPVDELTSENYTIRWYVLKLSNNGWHVDGVLVKKEGQLTVTKTFYGDADAIAEVKDGYSISVKEGGADGTLVHTLNLNQESENNPTGYTAYNTATNTYTWVIPLSTSKTYTLQEDGHLYKGSNVSIATLAEYSITNPETGTTPTNGRVPYDDAKGVSVVAKGYNLDLPYTSYQTVQFYNSYMNTEALTISKVDDSGVSLTGVSFRLYKTVDGQQVQQRIWMDEDGLYYTYEHSSSTSNATEIANGYITVDSQGYASVIGLANADYADEYSFVLLEELSPQGYVEIDPIVFTVNLPTQEEPNFSVNLEENAAAECLSDGSTIRITNTSVTMDVTVVKNWLDQTNLPVKVRLTLDGTPLNNYAEQTLSAENNWTATWTGVPAYVAGKLANYSVKETWIGSTAYNGSYADGYNDYLVSVAQSVYTYGEDGLPTGATITVSNQTHMGGFSFTKVDEKGVGLSGALFQLYSVESCEHIGSGSPCEHTYGDGVWSDLLGNVNFGSLAAGTYYMREITAPAGYEPNDTVYKVVVSGSGTTLTVNGSDTPISVIANTPASASINVLKVDGNGDILAGAVFRVNMYNEETGAYDITVARNGQTQFTSDRNGMLTVPELLPGNYKLIEVTAPAGYYRMAEEIEFTVALARINVTDESPNENSWSFDGEDTFTVVNVPGSELPQTGGMGTHYGTMAGLLMMAGSLLYIFLLRRKRERRGAV